VSEFVWKKGCYYAVDDLTEPLGVIEQIAHWKYVSYRRDKDSPVVSRGLGFTKMGNAKQWVEEQVALARSAIAKAEGK
jgi:hypothetical protein